MAFDLLPHSSTDWPFLLTIEDPCTADYAQIDVDGQKSSFLMELDTGGDMQAKLNA